MINKELFKTLINEFDEDETLDQTPKVLLNMPSKAKYSTIEKYLIDNDLFINRRMFAYYLKEGLLPEGIGEKKTVKEYTDVHIKKLIFILLLKDYIQMSSIKLFLEMIESKSNDLLDFSIEFMYNMPDVLASYANDVIDLVNEEEKIGSDKFAKKIKVIALITLGYSALKEAEKELMSKEDEEVSNE